VAEIGKGFLLLIIGPEQRAQILTCVMLSADSQIRQQSKCFAPIDSKRRVIPFQFRRTKQMHGKLMSHTTYSPNNLDMIVSSKATAQPMEVG
jgi:hypothetical protein